MSYDIGAMIEPLSVAIHAVDRAQLAPTMRVLILGAGPIGLTCAAVCKEKGNLAHIEIADIDQDRILFAREHGFAHKATLIPGNKTESTTEMLNTAISNAHTLTVHDQSTLKFDVVLECSGAEISTQTAIYSARPGGRVLLVGMGRPVQTIPIAVAQTREIDIVGTFRYANTYPRAIQMLSLEGGKNKWIRKAMATMITHTFDGLNNVQKAFKMAAKSHDAEANKVVLKVVVQMDPLLSNGM